MPKLLIEVEYEKGDGPHCDVETIAEEIMLLLDGETFYPQHPDKEEESTYEITNTRRVER